MFSGRVDPDILAKTEAKVRAAEARAYPYRPRGSEVFPGQDGFAGAWNDQRMSRDKVIRLVAMLRTYESEALGENRRTRLASTRPAATVTSVGDQQPAV